MADPTPTKTIKAPDGGLIHYPYLPRVGEEFHPPGPVQSDTPPVQLSAPPAQSTPATHVSKDSWRERIVTATRSAFGQVARYGHAVADALVVDDWKALTASHSSTLERFEAGADLASWAIPEGKVAEIVAHAIEKAGQIAAARLAESGFEHEATAAAAVAATRGLRRPLTEAERRGNFSSERDFKRFMGPASEGGERPRDWHHIVEKTHANDTHQFAAERVHSIENLVAIPRDVHQGADGITAAFQRVVPDLGMSRREFLRGKPWEQHVLLGERAIEARLPENVVELRAQTRERFEQRLNAHDQNIAAANQRGSNGPAPLVASLALDGPPSTRSPAELNVERDGLRRLVLPNQQFEGSIQSVDGDRIVQNLGRGRTAEWSRSELAKASQDADKFNAMIQPGNFVSVGINRNGVVDIQQRLPDHSWHSINDQPLAPHQQPHVAGHGREP